MYSPGINTVFPAYTVGTDRNSNIRIYYSNTSYINFVASSSQSTLAWTSTEAINILEIHGICKK